MILSNGKNEYKNNEFSYWEWSAPILQTHDEIISRLRELRLEGRVISDIRCVGMAYNWCDYSIDDAVYRELEKLPPEKRDAILEAGTFLPEGVYLPTWLEIDEPLLIKFEDGDILAVDYSEGSSVRIDMNTVPWDIGFGTNRRTIDAAKLFGDVISRRITSVEVSVSTVLDSFTGSYGLTIEEQPSYISRLSIFYDDGSFWIPHKSLSFSSHYDYGEVELRGHSLATERIHAPCLKSALKGFIPDDELNM